MARITAETQSMTSHPDGTEVQVKVIGPKVVPGLTKELRARAQAIVDAGPAGVAKKSASKITAGELSRFTRVDNVTVRQDPDFIEDLIPTDRGLPDVAKLEARLYTIIVEDR